MTDFVAICFDVSPPMRTAYAEKVKMKFCGEQPQLWPIRVPKNRVRLDVAAPDQRRLAASVGPAASVMRTKTAVSVRSEASLEDEPKTTVGKPKARCE